MNHSSLICTIGALGVVLASGLDASPVQGQRITTVAPVGTTVEVLGQLYTENFDPIRGGRIAFESPETVPVVRTYREDSRHASALDVRASAQAWGVGASGGLSTRQAYGYVRAVAVESVIQVPPLQALAEAPPGAAYFVSKILFGQMYEVRIAGSSTAVTAHISYLTGSGDLSASAESASAEGFTFGLVPRGSMVEAMGARTPGEITARFEASGPPVPILLELERVPSGGTFQISVVSLHFPPLNPNNMPWDGNGPDMRVVFSQGGRSLRMVNAPRNVFDATFTSEALGIPVTLSESAPLRLDFFDVDIAVHDRAGFARITSLRDGDNEVISDTGVRIVLRVVRAP